MFNPDTTFAISLQAKGAQRPQADESSVPCQHAPTPLAAWEPQGIPDSPLND